jgi:hypothetical protein
MSRAEAPRAPREHARAQGRADASRTGRAHARAERVGRALAELKAAQERADRGRAERGRHDHAGPGPNARVGEST